MLSPKNKTKQIYARLPETCFFSSLLYLGYLPLLEYIVIPHSFYLLHRIIWMYYNLLDQFSSNGCLDYFFFLSSNSATESLYKFIDLCETFFMNS